MKMNKILPMAIALASLAACEKSQSIHGPEQGKDGSIVISVDCGDALTKASEAFTGMQDYEKAVNSVQVFVFDEKGQLNAYRAAGKSTSDISISCTSGQKTVWAVVNGEDLSSISTMAALQASTTDLADNSRTPAEGFIMAGSASCTVNGAGTEVSVEVSRLTSRVALTKVTNSLPSAYGALTVKCVSLANVVGNQNLAGNASPATWYNGMGRKDGATSADQIIDGETNLASCAELTFASVGSSVNVSESLSPETPYLFYCYPNPTEQDASGWAEEFTARKTRLILTAVVGGKTYYYPVVLDKPARNTSYTVTVTITGLGSTDPDKPVEKGSMNVSVTVKDWTTGAVYDETI